MNEARLNYRRAASVPVIALLMVSAACAAFVGARIAWTGRWNYLVLIWNLFLAWLPLLFALGVCDRHQAGGRSGWRFLSLSALWLLFFPNAPYIFTDLIHLNTRFFGHYWVDLTLILLVALTGFLIGFVSLFLMQAMVAERVGRPLSWLFILAVAGLSGVGIYIGRFLRWNSWDALLHPLGLSQDLGQLAAHPFAHAGQLAIPVFFAAFLFFGYVMLYALTHLPQPQRQMAAG